MAEAVPARPQDSLVEALRASLLSDPEVEVAYLFGSQARASAGPLSDVDVAVLLSDASDHDAHQLRLSVDLAEQLGVPRVDVVVLNTAPLALGYRVLRDGSLLVNRDDRLRISHWTTTVDRYLDMAPARRMFATGLTQRLAEGRFGRR